MRSAKRPDYIPSKWAAVVVAVVILAGSAVLSWRIHQRESIHVREASEGVAVRVEALVQRLLKNAQDDMRRMVSRWESGSYTTQVLWERDARNYVRDHESVLAIKWINAALAVKSVVVEEKDQELVESQEPASGSLREAAIKARETRSLTLAIPNSDLRRTPSFYLLTPLYLKDAFDGLFAVRFQFSEFLSEAIWQAAPRYNIQIFSGGEPVYSTTSQSADDADWVAMRTLRFTEGDAGWKIVAWPKASELDQIRSEVPFIILLSGSALGALLGMLLLLYRSKGLHLRAAESEIRKRKEAEDALKIAHRQKDEFLATLSHELRTPLNIMTGYAEMLGHLEPDSTDFHHAVDRIIRAGEDQTALVSDLLDVSTITAGRLKLDVQEADLRSICTASLESVRFPADAKGVHVEFDFDPKLTYMACDATRVQQILWNLLSNSVKFTPTGGSVRLSMSDKGSAVRFEVSDTGDGFTPETRACLFQRFWQVDSSTTRKHGGLGLGLALTRHLVELHGGTISAFSPGLGKGAIFVVDLPKRTLACGVQAAPLRPRDATTRQARRERSDALRLSGLTVMVVEDNAANLELIEIMLSKAGARVEAFSRAPEALDRVMAEHGLFSALVCDIGMQEMDGYQFISQVREWESVQMLARIPAVALTGFASESDVARARSAGFDAHMAKPVNFGTLVETVCRMTETRALCEAAPEHGQERFQQH